MRSSYFAGCFFTITVFLNVFITRLVLTFAIVFLWKVLIILCLFAAPIFYRFVFIREVYFRLSAPHQKSLTLIQSFKPQ